MKTNFWGGYYLSPEENVTEVLNTLGPDLNWAIKSNKQIANGYTIWEIRWYDENLQLKSKYAKRVNDSLGNPRWCERLARTHNNKI